MNINNKELTISKKLPPPNIKMNPKLLSPNLLVNNNIVSLDPKPENPEKLKKIFIEKVQIQKYNKSFWLLKKDFIIKIYKEYKINFNEIEQEFFQNPIKTALTDNITKKIISRKSLLDVKRENNFAICLSRFKLKIDQITNILNNCLLQEITINELDTLTKLIPTKEEINILTNNKEEYDNMNYIEKFLFELIQIERFSNKINCLLIMKRFNNELSTFKDKFELFLEPFILLKNDNNLIILFCMTMRIINYLNHGSKNQNCESIYFEAFKNFKNILSTISKNNIYYFSIKNILEDNNSFDKVFDDYFEYKDINKLKISDFNNSVTTLTNYLNVIKEEYSYANKIFNNSKLGDFDKYVNYVDNTYDFIKNNEFKLNEFKDRIKYFDKEFESLCEYLLVSKQIDPEIFLNIIFEIFYEFKNVINKINKEKEELIKKEKEKKYSKKASIIRINTLSNCDENNKVNLLQSKIIKKLRNKVKNIKQNLKENKIKSISSIVIVDDKGYLEI